MKVDPAGGRIIIDGIDTSTIGVQDLRSRIVSLSVSSFRLIVDQGCRLSFLKYVGTSVVKTPSNPSPVSLRTLPFSLVPFETT